MHAWKLTTAALITGLSLAGFAGAAHATGGPATIEVPGPAPDDIKQGPIDDPDDEGSWFIYSRNTDQGWAGKQDAYTVIGNYLALDPSEVHGPDHTADHVYGSYSCSQGHQEGSPRLAIVCDHEGGLPVVAFQQAG